MSWSIKQQGAPQEVLGAVKADPGTAHMPDGLPLLIEDLLSKSTGTVSLSTSGHVYQGIGEVHLVIEAAEAEKPAEEAAPDPA